MKIENRTTSMLKAATVGIVLLFAVQARADITDPATLFIGPGAGTACATGGCPLSNGELNSIGSGGTVDIYQNSGGAATLDQPVYLILAIPNDTAGNAFASFDPTSDMTVSFINPYPGGTPVAGQAAFGVSGGDYNLTAQSGAGSDGYFGSMAPTSSKTNPDIYGFLQLQQPADNSNNFTNLSGYDASINGVSATSFGLYVFALSGSGLAANGLINVTFNSGSIPLGTFAVAYGFNCSQYDSSGTCTSGKVYDTPFTQAGLTTNHKVPEPNTLILLALAFPMLVWINRRRYQRCTVLR